MKAILLASSIFFFLGLKISNNVDINRKSNATPVIENKLEKPNESNPFEEDKKSFKLKTCPDSLCITEIVVTKKTNQKET